MHSRKSKSWFQQRLSELNQRLHVLTHFKSKMEDTAEQKKIPAVDSEIKATKNAIEKTRIESNFAALE